MLAKSSVKDILLSDQSIWNGWYNNIKGLVPNYLQKYFDTDNNTVFVELVAPVEPELELPLPAPLLAPEPDAQNNQSLRKTPKQ